MMKLFENNVFKVSVDTKKWLKATATRTVRSMAFTALSLIPTTGATLGSVNWGMVASAAVVSGIITALTCVAGVPEVAEEKED